jgi:polyhydroxyalkanoate synthesis regulator phasin
MRNIVKLAVYAGMGLYDRVREMVEDLVKRGELMQHEGEELIAATKEQETARLKGVQDRVEAVLRTAIEKMPKVASAKDVAALEERVRELEERLELTAPASGGATPQRQVSARTPARPEGHAWHDDGRGQRRHRHGPASLFSGVAADNRRGLGAFRDRCRRRTIGRCRRPA